MGQKCKSPDCQVTIPPQKGSARPRKYCETCRPPRNRGNPRVIPMSVGAEQAAPPPAATASASVVASYEKRLAASDVLGTPEGSHVMLLARLLEDGVGSMTAAGAASLSRELRAAMEAALKDAPAEGDVLDELSARRQQKASGA